MRVILIFEKRNQDSKVGNVNETVMFHDLGYFRAFYIENELLIEKIQLNYAN